MMRPPPGRVRPRPPRSGEGLGPGPGRGRGGGRGLAVAGLGPHTFDAHLFRELTAPALKAAYAGATLYFALQWNMYRAARRDATRDPHNGRDNDVPPDKNDGSP